MAGKKISQLSSSLAPSLSSVFPIVYSGVTYQTTLQSLRGVLVDSGSHNFTGSQVINGNLLVSGSVTASFFVGDGSNLTNLPSNTQDVSMFLSSSVFTEASSSFDQRINDIVSSGVPTGTISGSLQISELGYITSSSLDGLISGSSQIVYSDITGIPNPTDVSMFLSSSTFNSFTSSYNQDSASFDQRIKDATNEQDLSGYLTTNTYTIDSGSFDQRINDIANTGVPTGTVSGSAQIVDLGFAITGSNIFNGDQTINGSLIIKGVSEQLVINGTFDYSAGTIYYLTGLTSNDTWNVINVPTDNNQAVTFTFVIEQGSTAYSGSLYQINDETVTVKWADSIIPTGSANKTNVIGLTAFRVGSSWNVLGSLSTFGA